MASEKEKEVQIFFSDDTQETVKESYDFVLKQLETGYYLKKYLV